MSSENSGLSSHSLAELAIVVSRIAPFIFDERINPSSAALRAFWQSTRSLQHRWQKDLDEYSMSGETNIDLLEQIAPRLFATEIAVRTFGTVLIGLDRRSDKDSLVHIGRSAVCGLQLIRNKLLSQLLRLPETLHETAVKIDRLRRRCDRWVDLLIGPIALATDSFEFAYDPERARDFGEEGLMMTPAVGLPALEMLVSAGLSSSLLRHLPCESLPEPEFATLTKSILSCFPDRAFHRNGSLRSSLERRIAVSHRQAEYVENFQIGTLFSGTSRISSR